MAYTYAKNAEKQQIGGEKIKLKVIYDMVSIIPFQLCHAWWKMWLNIHNYTTLLAAALTLCASPNAARIVLVRRNVTDYHKYASHTHTHTQFIFHHCGRPQRIEDMLMCPAAFLFGARAGDDPALGSVGLYLQQNDCSIISMQILPEENKQAK